MHLEVFRKGATFLVSVAAKYRASGEEWQRREIG